MRTAEAQARLGPPVDTEVLFEPSVDRPDMGATPVPGELVAVLHWCCSKPMLYRVAKHVQKHKGVEMLTVDGERPGAWKAFYYSRLRRVDRPLVAPALPIGSSRRASVNPNLHLRCT